MLKVECISALNLLMSSVGARDHKIIYIDPHDEAAYTDAAEINSMF
jgi:hypothetical protein